MSGQQPLHQWIHAEHALARVAGDDEYDGVGGVAEPLVTELDAVDLCEPLSGHHAYASGAAPPGPGKSSSSRDSVSSASVIGTACKASSSCSMVRGPRITAVTLGRLNSQAMATEPGVWPRSAASFSNRSMRVRVSSARLYCANFRRAPDSLIPPNSPLASGLNARKPTPYAWQAGSSSSSTVRLHRL